MTRRVGRLLIALLVSTALAPPAPAHAEPGVFVFEGATREACFGCGVSIAHFAGTFTGLVGAHVYTNAAMEMHYSVVNPPTACFVTSTASGTMSVSDGTRTDTWGFNWTRSFNYGVVATIFGATNGVFVATYVPIEPPLVACGVPATFDMRGSGGGL